MKKTLTVNIKGINFTIEEDAYELLQDYLDRLELTLGTQAGSKEILEDVELRIAELCTAKLSESKTVIELADIQTILDNLGDPSEYVDNDNDDYEEAYESEGYSKNSGRSERRLFRDEEGSAIGGVCSGIANYFSIDVVIIRIIFIILLFSGFGFLLYLILWVSVPSAKNTIDRLRMKGRPITVDNVKNEVENAAQKIKHGSKRVARKIRDKNNYKNGISRGARILSSIIGFGLIGFGLMHLIGFMVVILGGFEFIPIESTTGFISLTELGELFLGDASDISQAWTGGLMASISFILFFLLLGSILLFHIRNKWAKLSLLGLFLVALVGFFICLGVGMRTAKDFVANGEIEVSVGSVQSDELVILPQLDHVAGNNDFEVKSNGGFGIMSLNQEEITGYGINILYEQSPDSLFHIKQNFTAQGHSHDNAINKSQNIDHGIELIGDTLMLSSDYSYPRKDKIRLQDVTVIIQIPDSAVVKVKNKIVHLGDENVDEDVEHPLYKERGFIRGDGTYKHDHWYYY